MAAVSERTAAERLLRDDLANAPFAVGCDRGYWRLVRLDWPFAVIAVTAAPRPGAPDAYALRFDFTGYPDAPTAQFWDPEADAPLPPQRWPGGGTRTQAAFNSSWNPAALYIPVDRLALTGHDAWRATHSAYVWDPAGDLTQYLRLVHELLNEESYSGVRD